MRRKAISAASRTLSQPQTARRKACRSVCGRLWLLAAAGRSETPHEQARPTAAATPSESSLQIRAGPTPRPPTTSRAAQNPASHPRRRWDQFGHHLGWSTLQRREQRQLQGWPLRPALSSPSRWVLLEDARCGAFTLRALTEWGRSTSRIEDKIMFLALCTVMKRDALFIFQPALAAPDTGFALDRRLNRLITALPVFSQFWSIIIVRESFRS